MGMPLPLVRLSSLDLIRGFVAVGRRMSITLAAQDLCLTQSAVSRQINGLERVLGVKLLVRGYRSISFTPEGERLFRSANGAVQQLQDVLGEIRISGELRPVTLSASIGVTGLWLLPRLSRFQAMHPGLDLRVSASNEVSDLRRDGIDLAIRYAPASTVPAGAIRLFGEAVAPVMHSSLCAPATSRPPATARPISAKALASLRLLEFDDPHASQHPWLQWNDWASVMGWGSARPQAVLHFNQYDQVIQAALAGQGIALGRLALIQPLLDEGRLVRLAVPGRKPTNEYAYWLIRAEAEPAGGVSRVATWLEQEAADTTAAMSSSFGHRPERL